MFVRAHRDVCASQGCLTAVSLHSQMWSALKAGNGGITGEGGGEQKDDNLLAQKMTGVAVRARGERVCAVRITEMLQKIKSNAGCRPIRLH